MIYGIITGDCASERFEGGDGWKGVENEDFEFGGEGFEIEFRV